MLNKNDLFKNYTLATDTVDVEKWGGEVSIQELSAEAIDEMRKLGAGQELQAAATIIIHGVIDDEGKRVFTNKDKKELLKMSVKDLNKLSEAILGVSGLNADEDDEEK